MECTTLGQVFFNEQLGIHPKCARTLPIRRRTLNYKSSRTTFQSTLSSLDPSSSISRHCKRLGPSAMFECVGTRANQVFNSQEHSCSMTFWTIRCAETVAPYPLHIAALAASLSRYITTCEERRRWLHRSKAMCTGRSSSSYIGLSEFSKSEFM